MSKYVIAMTVCNRKEKNGSDTLGITIESLRKSGLWESNIDFKLVLHDSGSVDTSYLDIYEKLPNVLVVRRQNKATILKNAAYMLDYIYTNLSADYLIYIEDDLLFCKNWIQNIDSWIKNYITPEDMYFSFYCPEKKYRTTKEYTEWSIDKFYGTQCFGIKFRDVKSLGNYFKDKNREGYEVGNDLFLAMWAKENSKKDFIKTSYPCLVQHMGIGSTLNSFVHQSPEFLGEHMDPGFHLGNPKSNLVCCMGSDVPELSYHFVKYYVDMGVDKFFIILHSHKEDANLRANIDMLSSFGIVPSEIWIGEYTIQHQMEKRSAICDTISEKDWIINVDLDEFISIPPVFSTLSDFLKHCNSARYTHVEGILVDRLSKDGTLIDIRKDIELEKEFPIKSNITGGLFGGCISKIPMCRGDVRTIPGHHFISEKKNTVYSKYPYVIDVNHFKWDKTAVDRMLVFSKDTEYKLGGEFYNKETKKFIEYIEKNGKINLSDISIHDYRTHNISITTACMNRKDLLVQALKTWVALPVDEIIIVDWSSKIPIHDEILGLFKDSRIKIIRVEGETYYNQSRASNLKVRLCKCDCILSIDSDIKLDSDFFESHPMHGSIFYRGNVKSHPGTTGTSLFSKSQFMDINGYNEFMEGWGYHDSDLYNRFKIRGFEGRYFNANKLHHIDHDDTIRVDNYEMKNKMFSNLANKNISIKKPWGKQHQMKSYDVTIYTIDSVEKHTI